MNRYRELSPFASAFAAEYKGFMKANSINNLQIAQKLGRNDGYVSERANGKRPLDTEDVDALAMLVPGWDGRALMMELARRTRLARSSGELIEGRFNVPTPEQTQALAASDDIDWQRRQEEENE